jgi:hypothetical protein
MEIGLRSFCSWPEAAVTWWGAKPQYLFLGQELNEFTDLFLMYMIEIAILTTPFN